MLNGRQINRQFYYSYKHPEPPLIFNLPIRWIPGSKNSFSEGYLDNNTPFSFHKHYDNDPIQVYGNWFGLDDQRWWSTKAHDHPDNVQRDEL